MSRKHKSKPEKQTNKQKIPMGKAKTIMLTK